MLALDPMSTAYHNRPRSRSRDRMSGSLHTSRSRHDGRDNRERDTRRRSRDRSRERRYSRSPPRRESRDERRDNRGTRNVLIDITSRVDPNLPVVNDDPRVKDNNKFVTIKGGGRNTESFDPASTLVRPDMRVLVGPKREVLNKKLKHDDILVVPEFFCDEDDYSIYYSLIEEMRKSQAEGVQNSEWISWHEGAHLISKNPTNSALFQSILTKIATYFNIELKSVGTRFNWYRDSSDWKPFHHDSAAFNAQRARNQNITVGVSFGMTRELAFLNANNGTKVYFPQVGDMMRVLISLRLSRQMGCFLALAVM